MRRQTTIATYFCGNAVDAIVIMQRDPRIVYSLKVLLPQEDGLNGCPAWLTYGGQAPADERWRIHVVASGFFGERHGEPSSLPTLPLMEIEKTPLLFGKPIVERRGNTLMVHADIIASTYFLVTRYEEWVRRDVRDEHGRFPGRESLPFRANFLDRPIVDEYAALLRRWAKEIGIEIPAPRRQLSALLTHDVDTLGPSRGPVQAARRLAGGLLGRRPFREALGAAAVALGMKRHPLDNLHDVIRLDQELARRFPSDRCRSIYFFMAGGGSAHDGAYDVASARIRNRLRQVTSAEAEIGLHVSYEAGHRPERIAGERRVLEQVAGARIHQNRHHYLAMREPEDARLLAAAGIDWDATLGYADVAGFRLGVCRPIPLFDPIRQCLVGIEEHPLLVMDCTLDRPNYMNLGEEEAFDYVCRLADATLRHRGEFVVLWHNTVLATTEPGYHRRLYPRVLDYLGQLLGSIPCAA